MTGEGRKTGFVVIGVCVVCVLGVLALGLYLGHVWLWVA